MTVGGGVERRADGRRVAVVVRGRVRQRVVVVVVEMMVVGVMAVSEVSLETGGGVRTYTDAQAVRLVSSKTVYLFVPGVLCVWRGLHL